MCVNLNVYWIIEGMESAYLLNVMRLEDQFCILALNAVC
jgi:hypothetical protein